MPLDTVHIHKGDANMNRSEAFECVGVWWCEQREAADNWYGKKK